MFLESMVQVRYQNRSLAPERNLILSSFILVLRKSLMRCDRIDFVGVRCTEEDVSEQKTSNNTCVG